LGAAIAAPLRRSKFGGASPHAASPDSTILAVLSRIKLFVALAIGALLSACALIGGNGRPAPAPTNSGVAPWEPSPSVPAAVTSSDAPTPQTQEGIPSAPPSTPPAPAPELPKGTLVLHVGDSFAGALGVPLGKKLKAAGVRSVLEFRTSSYIPTWASGKELPEYVSRYSPDLVIITLGANEFELANPEQRGNSVRRLVQKLDGRPCVWVSPPRWKQDTGVLGVIRDNVKPCRFLDTDSIVQNLERKSDLIHPNDVGREAWAEAVLAWLGRERDGTADRPWNLRTE
jgi:lysophospholipase L1-like esterase